MNRHCHNPNDPICRKGCAGNAACQYAMPGDKGRPAPNLLLDLKAELQRYAYNGNANPARCARLVERINEALSTASAVVPTEQFTDAHNALNLVDMLLCEAGYAHDSSLRHNLSIAKSMFSEAERRLSPSAVEDRTAAALHACEGLDTSDLAGNDNGWLAEVVHGAARVESELNSALRSRCAGNTDDDEPVCCQSYEASEQAAPCPRGCCVMAEEKDVRSILSVIEAEDGTLSPSATPLASKGTDWDTCNRCGAAYLTKHPEADPSVVAEQREAEKQVFKDAERYRWLKEHHLQVGPDAWIRTGDDLDDAIDAELNLTARTDKV